MNLVKENVKKNITFSLGVCVSLSYIYIYNEKWTKVIFFFFEIVIICKKDFVEWSLF